MIRTTILVCAFSVAGCSQIKPSDCAEAIEGMWRITHINQIAGDKDSEKLQADLDVWQFNDGTFKSYQFEESAEHWSQSLVSPYGLDGDVLSIGSIGFHVEECASGSLVVYEQRYGDMIYLEPTSNFVTKGSKVTPKSGAL